MVHLLGKFLVHHVKGRNNILKKVGWRVEDGGWEVGDIRKNMFEHTINT